MDAPALKLWRTFTRGKPGGEGAAVGGAHAAPPSPRSIPRRTAGHQHPAQDQHPQDRTPSSERTRAGGARLGFGRSPGSRAASPVSPGGLQNAGQAVRAASPPRRAPSAQGGLSWTCPGAPFSTDPPAVGAGPLGAAQATRLQSWTRSTKSLCVFSTEGKMGRLGLLTTKYLIL